jgi:hypothetical protein
VALSGAICLCLGASALAAVSPEWSDSAWLGGVKTTIPEPTTLVAGALLLLPFGASMIQVLRRNKN